MILLQNTGKESLGQILGILRIVTFAANKGVKRIPVSAAQFFECIDFLRGVLVAGGNHHTPMRCGEPMSLGRERTSVQSGTRHNTSGICQSVLTPPVPVNNAAGELDE